ncbi:MAG: hypothetical protein J6U45_01720 [Alistipes sp.]|nr:hypothetical protein [Alistipes sp.]
MIHEEIVTYDVAKLAKEKGYPQHIGDDAYIVENEYDDEYEVGCCYPIQFIPDYLPTITAPTQSLLQRWLREEKNVEIYVRHFEETNKYPHHFGVIITDNKGDTLEIGGKMFDTYELALEDALKYALENLV